jgi:hypothetical protein
MRKVKHFTYLFDHAESADIFLRSGVHTLLGEEPSGPLGFHVFLCRDGYGIRHKNQAILSFSYSVPNYVLTDL